MLRKWAAAGKRFVNGMELEDIAIMKFCLIAFGALVGLALPKKAKRPSALLAAVVFLGTFGTILYRFFVSLTGRERE